MQMKWFPKFPILSSLYRCLHNFYIFPEVFCVESTSKFSHKLSLIKDFYMVKFYFWLFSESYNCIISIFQFFVLLIWSLSLNILLASSSLILWAFITKTNIFIRRVASLISLSRINWALFPFENIRLPLINSSISINIHIILTLWSLLYQSFVCLFPQFNHIREFLTYKRKIL